MARIKINTKSSGKVVPLSKKLSITIGLTILHSLVTTTILLKIFNII
jgi:hypothetical protein